MPIKLIKRKGYETYFIRGTYLGVAVYESTKTDRKALALRILKQREKEIERSRLEPGSGATFLGAAVAYMEAGGDARPVHKLIEHFGETPLSQIGQVEIDNAAMTLFPAASSATRNREVYTPVAAVLHRAGLEKKVKRPKGWRGKRSTSWLEPEQAFAAFDAGDEIELEFGLFLRTLCYTGMRLSECLGVTLGKVSLKEQRIYLPDTKNGEQRSVYLPMHLIVDFANQPARVGADPKLGGRPKEDVGVPFMDRKPKRRLFRFTASGYLRELLRDTWKRAGLTFPRRQGGFHIFCHTYATWMAIYGDLDAFGLVRTGRWRDASIADGYTHRRPSAEARKADLLPTQGKKVG